MRSKMVWYLRATKLYTTHTNSLIEPTFSRYSRFSITKPITIQKSLVSLWVTQLTTVAREYALMMYYFAVIDMYLRVGFG